MSSFSRRMTIAFGAAVGLAVAPAAAQPWAPTPQFQVSTDLAVALRAKDATKAAALFVERGVLLLPAGETISGHREIEKLFTDRLGDGTLAVAIVSTGSSATEDLGYDSGTYEITLTPPKGQPRKARGTYLALQRQIEGAWKIDRLMLAFAWEPARGQVAPAPVSAPPPASPSPVATPKVGPPPGVGP
jgi:ketosteroid isomerase-like protein